MKLKDFTVEYRKNPLGLDTEPRFSWKLVSEQENTMQNTYQIVVSKETQEVWDSGVTKSEQSVLVPYQGVPLEAMSLYNVVVNVWDNHGEKAKVEGSFETGLLLQQNWKAKWITHSLPQEEMACPVFQYRLDLKGKKVKKARAYLTCCGIYELRINGKKAGEAFFAPGWTAYQSRLQYQVYDITSMLDEQSEITVPVGNGWYKGYLNGDGENHFYGDRVALLAMLCLEYEDGSDAVIGTDEKWEVVTGEICSAEFYHGEIQDYTRRGSTTPKENAVLFEIDGKIDKIVAQESEVVKITRRLPAKKKIITPKGEVIIDFGQNMAGFVEVKLPELIGEKLVISHAEALDKYGNFYTNNLRTAKATDEYIYGKEQINQIVMPHFTYHGFRYIRLEGIGEDIDINRFTACALHTDMEQTGTFNCNNEMINQLQSNIEWTQRSNFVEIPTDCPQRDERLGWTADAQIFSKTAGYNFNTALFFKKWMRDLATETKIEQGIPQVVPNIVGDSTGTAAWGDCATIMPWVNYMIYGDKMILEEQYENMCQWVEYIQRNCGDGELWMKGFQRGDWLSLDGDASLNLKAGGTDKNLVANVYYAYSTRIVRDTARILEKKLDEEKYAALYESIVIQLNEEYVTQKGRLVSETQTACVLLLYFDLIGEEHREQHREQVIKTLEDNLVQHRNHLTTGFIGTAYLCHALTENNLHNLAEAILLTEDYPGWLYAIKKGATTIWERWNSILENGDFDESGMNSLNHYPYGAIGDWIYKKIGGINFLKPGYKRCLIKPVLTKTITNMEASYETMYGTLRCSLQYQDGEISIDVEIPANTTAVLELPEYQQEIEVGSGHYHYKYKILNDPNAIRYSISSTIGEVLESEDGQHAVEKYLPEMFGSPMMNYMKGKKVVEVIEMAPERKEALLNMLEELNG